MSRREKAEYENVFEEKESCLLAVVTWRKKGNETLKDYSGGFFEFLRRRTKERWVQRRENLSLEYFSLHSTRPKNEERKIFFNITLGRFRKDFHRMKEEEDVNTERKTTTSNETSSKRHRIFFQFLFACCCFREGKRSKISENNWQPKNSIPFTDSMSAEHFPLSKEFINKQTFHSFPLGACIDPQQVCSPPTSSHLDSDTVKISPFSSWDVSTYNKTRQPKEPLFAIVFTLLAFVVFLWRNIQNFQITWLTSLFRLHWVWAFQHGKILYIRVVIHCVTLILSILKSATEALKTPTLSIKTFIENSYKKFLMQQERRMTIMKTENVECRHKVAKPSTKKNAQQHRLIKLFNENFHLLPPHPECRWITESVAKLCSSLQWWSFWEPTTTNDTEKKRIK